MSKLPPPRFDVGDDETVFHAIALWNDDYLDTLHADVTAADEREAEERVRESIRKTVAGVGPPDRVEVFTLDEWVRAGR